MDLTTKKFSKTGKGTRALSSRPKDLPSGALKVLPLIDSKTNAAVILDKLDRFSETDLLIVLAQLESGGYIRAIHDETWDLDDHKGDYRTGMVVEEVSADDFFRKSEDPHSNNSAETHRVRQEAEQAQKAAEQKAHVVEQALLKAEAEKTAARLEAERVARESAERQAREEENRRKAEEKARAQAEEAERKARETEEAKRKAEEEARLRAEAEARAEAEKTARLQAERIALEAAERHVREAEEARLKAEAEARAQAEKAARLEAERQAREDETRRKTEEKARAQAEEAERKARETEEAKRKAEEEARLRAEAEARAEAEKTARLEAERVALEAAERQVREAEEARLKAEAKAQAQAEKAARLETERQAREEETRRKAQEDAEQAARAVEEARRKAEEEARLRAEAEARAEAEKAARLEAERVARETAERQAREAEETRLKVAAETRAQAEKVAQLEAERIAREAAERQAREEEARRIAQEDAAQAARAVEEARRQTEEEARLRAEAEARAETEKVARLEAERIAREAEERLTSEEAEARRRAEAERRAQEEAEQRARKAEEARIKAEANEARRLAKEQARTQAAEKAQLKAESKAREQAERRTKKIAANLAKRNAPASAGQIASIIKAVGVYLPLALVLIIGAMHFVSLAPLAAPIEKIASESIGEPVKFGDLRAALVPQPQLVLSDVTIGQDADMKLGSVRAVLSLSSLFDDTKIVDTLDITDASLTVSELDRPRNWFLSAAKSGQVKIARISFKNAAITIPGLALTPFDGRIDLLPSGEFGASELSSADRSLTLQLIPEDDNWQITLDANNWQPPLSTTLKFDELHAQGYAKGRQARFDQIEGRIYGGTFTAKSMINWAGRPTASGNFELESVSLPSALAAAGSSASIEGTLKVAASFMSVAEEAEKLAEAAEINARFTAVDGKIGGIDLASSMLPANRERSTRFDKLTGSLLLSKGVYRYRNLALDTEQFHAQGNVDIQADQRISGNVSAELTIPSRRMKTNLGLNGTVGDVRIR